MGDRGRSAQQDEATNEERFEAAVKRLLATPPKPKGREKPAKPVPKRQKRTKRPRP